MWRPKIRVTFSHKEKAKTVIAILDTGSDLNYFPADFADYFDLPLSEKEFTAQGAEQEFNHRTSKIHDKLEHPHKSYRNLLQVMSPVRRTMHKDIILGMEFFKDFILSIDYRKGMLKLSENSSEQG